MNPEQEKEVSDLKYSSFMDSGIVFDHNKTSMYEALGVGEEEKADMQPAVIEVLKRSGPHQSKIIEGMITAEFSTKWKAIGLFEGGKAMGASGVVNMLMEKMQSIPDNVPGEVVKAYLMLALLGGKDV